MAWKVTANPDELERAVTWLRKRTAVTAEQYAELAADARARAFVIGGTTQLSVVQTVLREITRSVEKGGDLEEFRARIRQRLGDEFTGANARRLQFAHRMTVQAALGAGRWVEMNTPERLRTHKYRIFDAVLDDGTTELCWSLSGKVLRADDPWWRRHWPPLHGGCRSGVRAITTKQAMELGPSWRPRVQQLQPGYGQMPTQHWEPDPDDYDPEAFEVYERRQARRKEQNRILREVMKAQRRRDKKLEGPDLYEPELYNPHHDKLGRFASGPSGGGAAMALAKSMQDDEDFAKRTALRAQARGHVNDFLQKELGLSYQPREKSGSVRVRDDAPAGGTHSWDGEITIDGTRWHNAAEGLQQHVAGGRMEPGQVLGVQTFLHEVVHAHGPRLEREGYFREGRVVEEAVTETVARVATRKLLALEPDGYTAMPHGRDFKTAHGRSYDHEIASLLRQLGAVKPDWSPEQVVAAFEAGAQAYKSAPASRIQVERRELRELLATSIPGLSAGESEQFNDRIRRVFDHELVAAAEPQM